MNTSKDARKGFSAGQWPVDGGCDGSETCSYSELVITGHADGSIRYDFLFFILPRVKYFSLDTGAV